MQMHGVQVREFEEMEQLKTKSDLYRVYIELEQSDIRITIMEVMHVFLLCESYLLRYKKYKHCYTIPQVFKISKGRMLFTTTSRE